MKLDTRLSNLPSNILIKIAQIDELKGRFVAGVPLSPQVLDRLKRSVLVTSSGASTRIEGAKMSDEDIEKMLRGISMQKFADRDQQEVKGYYELLQNVFSSWQELSFSESLIKHFHKELLKYTQKDEPHRGEYKKSENKVEMINEVGQSIGILFNTTAAYLTPKEMQELVEWTKLSLQNKKYHPLLIIANFLVEFLSIHPFTDGNGRLSRILTNLLFLKEGYSYVPYVSHEKLIEENKPEYYLALRNSQKTFNQEKETIVPWLEFFLEVIFIQTKKAVDLLSSGNFEKTLSLKQLEVWQLFQKDKELVPREIYVKTKISRPTINQVLSKLVQLKKIEKIGLGRATRYILVNVIK